jgi:hypothetical protein
MELTASETREINDYCFKEHISAAAKQTIVAFVQAEGFYAFRTVRDMVESDKGPEAAGWKWGKWMPKFLRAKVRQARRHDEAKKRYEDLREYEASWNSGYRARNEEIAMQLSDMVESGTITQAQYDVGMRFLEGDTSLHTGNVSGELVEAVKGVDDDIPF